MKHSMWGVICLWVLLSACAKPAADTVFQASTIDALLAGVYDGDISIQQVQQEGDFGIGTYDALDGEMILLDGAMYQVKADGKVYLPDPLGKTPFATVCNFSADTALPLPAGADFETVEQLLDDYAPNQNLFYAIKIEGHFKSMHTRSVPSQQKPYLPLKEVTKNQPEFTMTNVSGTIVGSGAPPM